MSRSAFGGFRISRRGGSPGLRRGLHIDWPNQVSKPAWRAAFSSDLRRRPVFDPRLHAGVTAPRVTTRDAERADHRYRISGSVVRIGRPPHSAPKTSPAHAPLSSRCLLVFGPDAGEVRGHSLNPDRRTPPCRNVCCGRASSNSMGFTKRKCVRPRTRGKKWTSTPCQQLYLPSGAVAIHNVRRA